MKIVSLFIWLLITVLVIAFALLNDQVVTLDYFLNSVELPLATALLLTLAVGAVLGVAAALLSTLRQKRLLAKARRELAATQKELDELRTLPIKEGK